MSLTEELTAICARPVSPADRERAAMLLLDWTGCAVGALLEPLGRKAMGVEFGEGRCSRLGRSPGSELAAVLHNGLLGNVLEMDDVDARAVLHPGPAVMPAVLAVAQSEGAGAEAVLDAVVRGYEATIRVGRAVGPSHYRFFHNTATCGVFGAAVAACDLMGADAVAAMGLAGTQAAGLWQTRHDAESDAKQVHAAHAGLIGVQSARFAQGGLRGPRAILEGEQGFFAALAPEAEPGDVLFDAEGWLIHETTIKPYPACRHAHAAIDAALELREAWDGEEVVVRTYADALKFCDRAEPGTPLEAKFSLQHMVALTLLKGVPKLEDFTEDAISDAEVAALRARVRVEEDAELSAAYPEHYGARVNGVVVRDAYGDPARPMSREAVVDKAVALMRWGGMQVEGAQVLVDAALRLAEGGEMDAYFGAWV